MIAAALLAAIDLRAARLIAAPDRTGPEDAAITMLVEEVAKRSGVRWGDVDPPPLAGEEDPRRGWRGRVRRDLQAGGARFGRASAVGGAAHPPPPPLRGPAPPRRGGGSASRESSLVIAARAAQVRALLPERLRAAWRTTPNAPPEGFTFRVLHDGQRAVVVLAGADARGLLFAAGYLLRKLETGPGRLDLPPNLDVVTAPAQGVRSTQIGYRFKNNSYDAWTLPMFEQRIRDFAIFGANGVQVIAPESDDAAQSPLFPTPALTTIVGVSRILDRYGLDFDLYYPEMRDDDRAFAALVGRFHAIHALFVPGGDPGHASPDVLFARVAVQAAILRRRHPAAQVWISGQGFDAAQYERFYALLARRPAWLTGVFFGPQSRDPLPVQRRRVPARYPILIYPDIGHAMHAQFPVEGWRPAFAVTEGREPIIPRPLAETAIFRRSARWNVGAVTYSEGVNDDVNALLWMQLGWSPGVAPEAVLKDYARTFLGARIGARSSDSFAEGLFALERNWIGDPATNPAIDATLARLDALDAAASPAQRSNWRFESALYRATYDAWVRRRAQAEAAREAAALGALSDAPTRGAALAMTDAARALDAPDTAAARALRTRLFDLAARLWAHARLQLSVKLYGASGVERGANLDRVDAALNDRVWLEARFTEIAALPRESSKLAALAELADWPMARAGAHYDDLGDPAHEPHLVRGSRSADDPQRYEGANDGVADTFADDGWRTSWVSYAETLYDRPLTLAYRGLDPGRDWRVRVTYAGEGYATPLRLIAGDGREILPLRARATNPMTVEAPIPRAAIHRGALTLEWVRPAGSGGSGRGRQVAEVWLIPQPRTTP